MSENVRIENEGVSASWSSRRTPHKQSSLKRRRSLSPQKRARAVSCFVPLVNIIDSVSPLPNCRPEAKPSYFELEKELRSMRSQLNELTEAINPLKALLPLLSSPDPLSYDLTTLHAAANLIDFLSSEISNRLKCKCQVIAYNVPDKIPAEKAKMSILQACGLGSLACKALRLRKYDKSTCCPLLFEFKDDTGADAVLKHWGKMPHKSWMKGVRILPSQSRLQRELAKGTKQPCTVCPPALTNSSAIVACSSQTSMVLCSNKDATVATSITGESRVEQNPSVHPPHQDSNELIDLTVPDTNHALVGDARIDGLSPLGCVATPSQNIDVVPQTSAELPTISKCHTSSSFKHRQASSRTKYSTLQFRHNMHSSILGLPPARCTPILKQPSIVPTRRSRNSNKSASGNRATFRHLVGSSLRDNFHRTTAATSSQGKQMPHPGCYSSFRHRLQNDWPPPLSSPPAAHTPLNKALLLVLALLPFLQSQHI